MTIHLEFAYFVTHQTDIAIKAIVDKTTLILIECCTNIHVVCPMILELYLGVFSHGIGEYWQQRHVSLCFVHRIDGSTKLEPSIKLFFEGYRKGVSDAQASCSVISSFWTEISIRIKTLASLLLNVFLGCISCLKHMAESGNGHILYFDGVFLYPFSFLIALAVVHFALALHTDAVVVIEVAR